MRRIKRAERSRSGKIFLDGTRKTHCWRRCGPGGPVKVSSSSMLICSFQGLAAANHLFLSHHMAQTYYFFYYIQKPLLWSWSQTSCSNQIELQQPPSQYSHSHVASWQISLTSHVHHRSSALILILVTPKERLILFFPFISADFTSATCLFLLV